MNTEQKIDAILAAVTALASPTPTDISGLQTSLTALQNQVALIAAACAAIQADLGEAAIINPPAPDMPVPTDQVSGK